ncbi:hypothetical protein Tco_0994168 [Tanacetum coccineum]
MLLWKQSELDGATLRPSMEMRELLNYVDGLRISEYAEERKVKFAAATLQGRAFMWWNSQVATRGLKATNQITWTEMKKLMTEEFCLAEEIQ